MNNGKDFERDVCGLLQLQQWTVVPEHILGHKRIDAYAQKVGDFNQVTRAAIECKDYSGLLSQGQVTAIYANYLPLIEQGLIDRVVLITRGELAPSAKTFAQSARGMVHLTFMELQNSLLDLRSYIQGLILEFQSDEVSKYYVRQRFTTDSKPYQRFEAIEDAVLEWIASQDDFRPLAVLGGYGLGKTTLAKRLAFLLAERHKADPASRVPIYIRLEELGSEQSLEGLIGKHFTTTVVSGNYNFNVFMELNRRGRFVVFLDGFDEMRQTMSWDVMRYNFQQLNRLVVESAKVVLGGRPSAFISEEEHLEALHGKRPILGAMRTIQGWPEYQEFHLDRFSPRQIEEFIDLYTGRAAQEAGFQNGIGSGIADFRALGSTDRSNLLDLASRPVQLKMLLQIMPTWQGDLDTLTRTLLYSEFIDLIIRREMEKTARHKINARDRRQFVRDLAWWMATEGTGGVTFPATKIPDSLFSRFVAPGQDIDDVKRDLLSAGFVEVKQPGGYYFPHRSFQEYLVAEKLANLFENGQLRFDSVFSFSPETKDFFSELIQGRTSTELLKRLWGYRGILGDWLLDSLMSIQSQPTSLLKDTIASQSPWSHLLLAVGVKRRVWGADFPGMAQFLEKTLTEPPRSSRAATSREWAKLLVTLNILLADVLSEYGYDVSKRLPGLMSAAGTSARWETHGDWVSSIALLGEHKCPDFCYLASWNSSDWSVDDQDFWVEFERTTEDHRLPAETSITHAQILPVNVPSALSRERHDRKPTQKKRGAMKKKHYRR